MGETHTSSYQTSESKSKSFLDINIPLEEDLNLELEKAICSHGLFMMSPNKWDPLTKSLLRPLRLSQSPTSVLVRVFQIPHALIIRVYNTRHLCTADCEVLVAQVKRMLRLSELEEKNLREFQEMGVSGFGRVFRSPTLFEDMVKCILFCNCQWPRTLSMAQALCDLQLELQNHSSIAPVNAANDIKSKASAIETSNFIPATPAIKESKSKRKMHELTEVGENADNDNSKSSMDSAKIYEGTHMVEDLVTTLASSSKNENRDGLEDPYQATNGFSNAYLEGESTDLMGNFPSPEEIAGLTEKYLAKRCGLGYRAGRILKLAQGVVDGNIQLGELEELCNETSIINCDKLNEKLKEINGFGPFTRNNVLMCMGFYNVVPTDSETIRHLEQVHARKTTVKTVKEVVDEIYGKYEPFQFLAYWSEIWKFYEDWFGKLSEMPASDYKLITASNMKANKRKHNKHKN